jgi:FkbM family methyltransferase
LKKYWNLARGHKKPRRFLAARLLMATGLCRFFTIKQRDYDLRFHAANLSSQLWIDPNEREEALAFFREYLKPGDRVVDVGANIGDTVLTASRQVGPSGHVVGVEAHPRTFGFLVDNIRLNCVVNVELINCAVGVVSGTVLFSDERRDDMNRVDGGNLEVKVARLDELVPDTRTVALLKVDVEGYEKFVFEGAPRVLRRTQCVYFEVSAVHFRRFGYSTPDLLWLLRHDGFGLFRIAGPKLLSAVSDRFDTERYENLLGIRDVDEFCHRTSWAVR